MRSPAKELLDEIMDSGKISLRTLAREIRVRPSTLSRIKNGITEGGSLKTYLRILGYKKRMESNHA